MLNLMHLSRRSYRVAAALREDLTIIHVHANCLVVIVDLLTNLIARNYIIIINRCYIYILLLNCEQKKPLVNVLKVI